MLCLNISDIAIIFCDVKGVDFRWVDGYTVDKILDKIKSLDIEKLDDSRILIDKDYKRPSGKIFLKMQ